ncbi:MAG: hypothetical protein QM689_03250 [Oscillospiraceae bacterium]
MSTVLRIVEVNDIPDWMNLSHEYDQYVEQIGGDLEIWYGGNDKDTSFSDYMTAKIVKHEAVMVTDDKNMQCFGVIAFSRKHNRITFFAISHTHDFETSGNLLIEYALSELDVSRKVIVNIMQCTDNHLSMQRKLFQAHGFQKCGSDFENGVPVDVYFR